MALSIDFITIRDSEGHDAALLLRGDWIFVRVSDGRYTGTGEATHSGDDRRCMEVARELFDRRFRHIDLDLEHLRAMERECLAETPDFLTATAVSAINQALYELLARRNGVPVWRLFRETPARSTLPVYVTINRALGRRDVDDYREVLSLVRRRGFSRFKCAPFEKVTPESDQRAQAQPGLEILREITSEFDDLELRIDCHHRFKSDVFLDILPELERLAPAWIEEPFEIGPEYANLRNLTEVPLAAGELFFGVEGFRPIIEGRWADVIMPDVKHVGGFGPLLDVCSLAQRHGVRVSPHNPSGPISTIASLHAAAVSGNVDSLELPFSRDAAKPAPGRCIRNGAIALPDGPGWGIDLEDC